MYFKIQIKNNMLFLPLCFKLRENNIYSALNFIYYLMYNIAATEIIIIVKKETTAAAIKYFIPFLNSLSLASLSSEIFEACFLPIKNNRKLTIIRKNIIPITEISHKNHLYVL